MDRCDVMVVGAGLAGLQCAHELGRAGLSVLLLDARPSVARSVHTTGIFVRKTLEDFDLPEECLGAPIRDVTLHSPSGRTLHLASDRDEFRIGRMPQLYEQLLTRCLGAGVAWLPAARYTGCEGAGEKLVVRLEAGGRARWVSTRFIIGADGARSLVAQDLGLDVNREWIVGVEEVLARRVAAPGPPELHCYLDPEIAPGYLAWVADDGSELHIGVGGYPSRFDPLTALERFRAGLGDRLDLAQTERIERRGGRIPVGGVLSRLANERGLLIGDAAGAPSPLTAGGLDPCMRLSRLAARIVARYLATHDARILKPYTGRRFRPKFIARRAMRKTFASIESRASLEALFRLVALPPLRPFVAHLFFGRGSFPDVPVPGLHEAPAARRAAI